MKYQLIDEIVNQQSNGEVTFIPDGLPSIAAAQVIKIDNVDEYHFAHAPSDHRKFSDYPNIAPPFSNYFMSVDRTHMLLDEKTRILDMWPAYRHGVWFVSSPMESAVTREAISVFSEMNTNRMILRRNGVKWFVTAMLWEQESPKFSPSVQSYLQYFVSEDGAMYSAGVRVTVNETFLRDSALLYRVPYDYLYRTLYTRVLHAVSACLFATSLMHCKNVELIDAVLTPQEKHRASEFERKHRTPAAKWKTLRIEPMKRTLSAVGGIEKNGLIKALHICRGHFKDYSKGPGLFGRNKGLYWWDQHMRGDESAGVIIKEYDIAPGDTGTT